MLDSKVFVDSDLFRERERERSRRRREKTSTKSMWKWDPRREIQEGKESFHYVGGDSRELEIRCG